jgi:hypothetical protein
MIGQTSPVNFKSTPLHHVNIRKVENGATVGFEKMMFSKLDNGDSTDRVAVKFIGQNWVGAPYAKLFDEWFNEKPLTKSIEPRHYAVELLDKGKDLAEKIQGLLRVKIENYSHGKNLDVSLIQSHPDLLYTSKYKKRSLAGFGEVMLGECFKIAKKENAGTLVISSTNDEFYDKTFERAKIKIWNTSINSGGVFRIEKSEFDKYINYVNEKYKM